MTSFVAIDIETDPDQDYADAVALMAATFPGWESAPGQLEDWLIRAMAFLKASLAELAADVPAEIFAAYGTKIVNLPPQDAVAAMGQSTWTMVDTAGYTIPAGTNVTIQVTGDELAGFTVRDDVVVPPGASVTATGEVLLEAIEPGAASNDLNGTVDLVDSLSFVADGGIVLEANTSGGVDAESLADYLDRLADEMTLLAPRPILANDFAVFARQNPSVFRAVAIDGYDPADHATYDPTDPSTWKERFVTVAIVDQDGNALSSGVKTAVQTDLDGRRELNFEVRVIDPSFTSINVQFSVVLFAGFDQATVEGQVIDALSAYLSPENWGLPPSGEPAFAWINQSVVRYQDLSTLINNVEGVDYHTNLKLSAGTNPLATSDVNLATSGPAPLVQPGTIAVG
jgi:baseplate J-like protein